MIGVLDRNANLTKAQLTTNLAQAESLIESEPDNALKVDVLTLMSHHLSRKGESVKALGLADKALALAVAQGDKQRQGHAYYQRAVAHYYQSQGEMALLEARASTSLYEEIDDLAGAASSYTLIGAVHRSRSEYEASVAAHKQALNNSIVLDDKNGIARSRNNIGLVYWRLGKFESAREYFESVLDHYRQNGPVSSLTTILANLGLIYVEVDEIDKALVHLDEGLSLLSETDNPRNVAILLSNKAFAYERRGEFQRAMDFYERTVTIRESLDEPWKLSRSLASMARIKKQFGNLEGALIDYERAQNLAVSADAKSELVSISRKLSELYEELGRPDDALRALRLSYETRSQITDNEALQLIGSLEAERNRAENALLLTKAQHRQSGLAAAVGFLLVVALQLAWFARSRSRSLATATVHVQNLEVAKGQLQESEQRYRSLFNDAVVPKYLVDIESGRVLEGNEPASTLSNVPTDSLANIPVGDLEPLWLRASMANLGDLGDEEVRITTNWYDENADRRYADISFNKATLQGAACAIVAVHDSTEERRWEKERERIKKLESLGDLANRFSNSIDNQFGRTLGNLASFVADDAEFEVHDIRKVLKEAAQFYVSGSDVTLQFDIDEALWPVEADVNQFKHLLFNLVENSREAMADSGSILISASNVETSVPLGPSTQAGRFVKVAIADSGTGVEPADAEQLFDPFFTTKTDHEGLGLASALAIAKRHGGWLQMEASADSGAVFAAYFPAGRLPTTITGDERVLLVSADSQRSAAYRDFLADLGYKVSQKPEQSELENTESFDLAVVFSEAARDFLQLRYPELPLLQCADSKIGDAVNPIDLATMIRDHFESRF